LERKAVSGIMLPLLLASMLSVAFNIQPTGATGIVYIRADGSVDPLTTPIQREGDIYTFINNIYDSIVVERSNIIIDGNGYVLQGTGAYLSRGIYLSGIGNVTVKNTNIQNFDMGIYLDSTSLNVISGNNIANNWFSVSLYDSSYNIICGNKITTNKYCGIELIYSSNNFLRNNAMAGNRYSFNVFGDTLLDYINDVDASNTVDGKPIYYWIGRRDAVVPLDAGYVVLVNCTGIKVENLTLIGNGQGILLAYTVNSTVVGNNATKNSGDVVLLLESSSYNSILGNKITTNDGYGIYLRSSNYNNISGNTIANNWRGIALISSSNNSIYHNCFIKNGVQIINDVWSVNVWDDGYPSGGNYWSDYTIRYPSARELDDSGLWDTPYYINDYNRDRYPLMNPWTPTPPVAATIDICPDTLNLRSKGRWIIAYLQLPEGYNAADIDATFILLNGTISPVLDPKYGFVTNSSEYLLDHNNDGILERMVKFDRASVESFITSQGIGYGNVALTVTGKLFDGTPFEGTDIIFVVSGGAGGRRK
jgi:parallel beta-helix repeat protein